VIAVISVATPVCARAQSDRSTEQIETGRVRLPTGVEVVYRIRLLPLASFPALPTVVAAQLDERKCMVPQTYEARAPENVVRASLERIGSEDWAVLCSVNGATTLYVFFQSQPAAPIALRRQRDTEWLGSEMVGAYGSAWGIARRSPSQMRALKGKWPDEALSIMMELMTPSWRNHPRHITSRMARGSFSTTRTDHAGRA